ncbi:unnamed protein product [Peronospora destructor]|uniref:Uncharacterized protein n=1 Tax=Peronospora destructor TaxID=86335 RepID=A0AAV0V6H4_9STRA|nr:unnamed protein product [Peronospora destructor]
MQTWSNGHRKRERSSSVVLLGKLSAIVRRGSVFQSDREDVYSSNSSNSYSSYEDKKPSDDEAQEVTQRTRRCSMGTTPIVQSKITTCGPLSSESCNKSNERAMIQRLQFYPVQPLCAAALARRLSHDELMRRTTLEGQMREFSALHESFAPLSMTPNDQEEKQKVTEAEEARTYELDSNKQEIVEEEEPRADRCFEEDVAVEDASGSFKEDDKHDDLEENKVSENSEELDFDPANMRTSVRKLMNRTKREILLDESDLYFGSASEDLSNQDDGCHKSDDNEEEDENVDKIDCLNKFGLDNNRDDDRSSSEQEEALTQEMSPTEHCLQHCRRARLLSCEAEHVILSAQDQLTSSVRRLVIELKDDSDQVCKPLAQSHGIRRTSILHPLRRRAGSCPSAYDLNIPFPNDEGFPIPTPLRISPVFTPEEAHPGKKHKKSAFSRIGPRVLETLHLRKKRKTYLFTDEELETIEGARWKIVELAFRFGGKHRSYLVQAINMFFPMIKYGRRGGAHATRLHCNCCGTLQWQHKRGGLSQAVDLAGTLQVLDGRQTAVFHKYPSTKVLEACSFSVVFRDRTLDLETQSSSHRDWLVSALRTIVAYACRQRCIEQQAIAERAILPLEDYVFPTFDSAHAEFVAFGSPSMPTT